MPNEQISSREFGALEQQVKHLDEKVQRLEERVEAASEKLDTLLALANQGKGAWWAALTASAVIGSVISWFGHSFIK